MAIVAPTRFTHPASVETWDNWFRWRQGDVLRDVTINDTWRRVAQWVAHPEGPRSVIWANRFRDAFSHWRLLPDERVLRHVGTDSEPSHQRAGTAVLNVAAFITSPIGAEPRFEYVRFMETAALAVRFLDNAAIRCSFLDATGLGPRVSLIGLGDALEKLGVDYGSNGAQRTAQTVVRALAEGCLLGSVTLAEERGAMFSPSSNETLRVLQRAEMSPWLKERVSRSGLRHSRMIAIDRHPLLARLANGTSDAFDPTSGRHRLAAVRASLIASVQQWIDHPYGPQRRRD